MNGPMREDFFLRDWLVQPHRYRLVRDGAEVRLTERTLRALLRLADANGELVHRDTLFEAIWPDTVVSEDSLFRTIADLRSALGDDARNPTYIATVRQNGYRLIAPVHRRGNQAYSHGSTSTITASSSAHALDSLPSQPVWWLSKPLLALGLMLLTLSAGAWISKQLSPTSQKAPLALVPKPVTSDPALEIDPSLSPDGSLVAFVRTVDSSASEIFVQHIDGDYATQLTHHAGGEVYPTWSPDGNAIAFARYVDQEVALHTIPLAGGRERLLLDLACPRCEVCGLTWHPSGDYLTFALRPPDAASTLATLDLATQTVTTRTSPPTGTYGDRLPAWDPSGTRLAFVRGERLGDHSAGLRPVQGQAMVLHGDRLQALTSPDWEFLGLAWENETHMVVAGSPGPGEPAGLWRMPLDGTPPALLYRPSVRLLRNLSMREGQLVFESWQATVDLWQVALDGRQKPHPVVSSTHFDHGGQYSPTGEHIAFISSRSGRAQLWIAQAGGLNPTRITSFDEGHVRGAAWSTSGEHIAFVHTNANHATLYLTDAHGAKPRPIWETPSPLGKPSFTNDGQALLVGAQHNENWDIWRVPLDGANPHALGLPGGHVAVEQPNGELLVTLHGKNGLYRWKPGSPNSPMRFYAFPYASDWANWALTESGVIVLNRDARGTVRLDVLDLQGHLLQAIPLTSLSVQQGSLSLGVSNTGNEALVAVRTGTTSDVVSLHLH